MTPLPNTPPPPPRTRLRPGLQALVLGPLPMLGSSLNLQAKVRLSSLKLKLPRAPVPGTAVARNCVGVPAASYAAHALSTTSPSLGPSLASLYCSEEPY